MPFPDIMMKMADAQPLTPSEREELRQISQVMDSQRQILTAWTGFDKKLNSDFIKFPISFLHNEVLEQDKASIFVYPPSVYRTLIILGSGSITTANGGNVWAQFNGDTGNNYAWQYIKGDNTTISGTQDTSDPYVVLGVFGTTGAGAGVNGSFIAFIPNSNSNVWKKNVESIIYTAEFNDLYLAGSTWADTTPVTSIEIFATDNTLVKGTASLASGSLITVIGLL